ncbi:uncharacterized protein LOC34621927 [Cyclospora cayetanensis]|uniref:Uncharacterized protein LOC34621927 n=1 Tax=Cyclospora cayetanensis TaxID=88456 RepID=A0A6P6RY91_9EIME|nr:uncharacterized protein LOC34621927 [Cyclospora cayetanensis]
MASWIFPLDGTWKRLGSAAGLEQSEEIDGGSGNHCFSGCLNIFRSLQDCASKYFRKLLPAMQRKCDSVSDSPNCLAETTQIGLEPFRSQLPSTQRCPICRGPCRNSEVVSLQFELLTPPEGTKLSWVKEPSRLPQYCVGEYVSAGIGPQADTSVHFALRGMSATLLVAFFDAILQLSLHQMRLSMARANVNALLEADARREREHELLKNRVSVLEDEIHSHVSRATEAEARAADFRTRLVRANASKDRLAAELVQAKKQLDIESTRRQ